MPRRFTTKAKIEFARYMTQHDHIQAFTLDMVEYEELCCLLKINPRSVRKQTFVNVVNLNLLLAQYRMNREEWTSLLERAEPDESEGRIIEQGEIEKCTCEHCKRSAAWNGIRRYKFTEYEYEKLSFTVEISREKWKEWVTIDKKENLKMRPGFAGLITTQLRKNGWQCIPAVKDNYFVITANCLRVTAYCVWGDVEPCNLLILEYFPDLPECNPHNQSKIFLVRATDLPLRHCANSYRVPQIRGDARNSALTDSSKMTPKTHDQFLVTRYGEINSQVAMDKWPASRQSLKNVRSEYLNRFRLTNDNVTELAMLWEIERVMPESLVGPLDDFRYVQYVSIGPLNVILMSADQIKILKSERLKYDQSKSPKRPRFSVQLDATGSIIAPVKNCDEKKRRYNYALVLPIHIARDTSKHNIIFSIADFISNDHTGKNIHFFLSEIVEKQPGIQAIVTDFCWAQINAIVKLNHGINVEAYLKLTYKYVTANDDTLQKHMDSTFIFCFLCLTHLSKNILRDLSTAVKDKKVLTVLQSVFVEMAHCKEYVRLLELFRVMCVVYFTNNCITKEFVRFVSEEDLNKLLTDVQECHEEQESKEEDPSSIPLYEASPFFKDCEIIFEEVKKKYGQEKSEFIEMFMKKYMAYVPMWTAICHVPRSDTGKQCYIPLFRFNTNSIEKYWGDTKEDLRAQVLEYGKTPIPIPRYIRYKKTQTRADIIRYRSEIPISRMSCRPGTFQTKMKTRNDVVFEEISQPLTAVSSSTVNDTHDITITTVTLESIQAKWDRKSKADLQTTPKGLPYRPIQKKLFDKRLETVSIKATDIDDYIKKKRNMEQNKYYRPYYVARFGNTCIDVHDMSSLAPKQQIYDSCLDAVMWLLNSEQRFNIVDTHTASKIFKMGLYENIDHLGVELHHQFGAILVKMISSDKESLICICHDNHFYLALLKMDVKKAKGCRIVLYDSLVNASHLTASELYDRFESQVQKVLSKTGLLLELPAKNKWLLKNENCAQQRDNYNCGVYAATFAEKLIKGVKTLRVQFNADAKRSHLFEMLQRAVEQQKVCFNCCRALDGEFEVAASCEKCGAPLDGTCLQSRYGEGSTRIENCPACEP